MVASVKTFRYVLRNEGWHWALRWALDCWVKMPWQGIRIKIAETVLALLRVTDYFE